MKTFFFKGNLCHLSCNVIHAVIITVTYNYSEKDLCEKSNSELKTTFFYGMGKLLFDWHVNGSDIGTSASTPSLKFLKYLIQEF